MKGQVSKSNNSTDKIIGFYVIISLYTYKHNPVFNAASQNY
jgi:hypothetical protein